MDKMKVFVLVVVSMMVALDMSHACTESLVVGCQSYLQSSLSTIKIPSEACRVIDTYIQCFRSCEYQDSITKYAYRILSDSGIVCDESQTSTQSPGTVGTSPPQVIRHTDIPNYCEPSLIADCTSSLDGSLRNVKTKSQACRVMDTYLDCVRSCGSRDLMKKLVHEMLSDRGIQCGESPTSSPPQVIGQTDCTRSLLSDCQNMLRYSLETIRFDSQGCRILHTYLDCVRSCGNPEHFKNIAYGMFYELGVVCGEFLTPSQSPGAVGTSPPQVIGQKYSCTQSLIKDCLITLTYSLGTIKTHSQGCRIMDTYLDCLRSCGNPEHFKNIAYGILSDSGIECGESPTSSPPQVESLDLPSKFIMLMKRRIENEETYRVKSLRLEELKVKTLMDIQTSLSSIVQAVKHG